MSSYRDHPAPRPYPTFPAPAEPAVSYVQFIRVTVIGPWKRRVPREDAPVRSFLADAIQLGPGMYRPDIDFFDYRWETTGQNRKTLRSHRFTLDARDIFDVALEDWLLIPHSRPVQVIPG